MNKLTIYHGSTDEIVVPVKSKGKTYNDYGQGFYCTVHFSSAAEWACKMEESGLVNEYVLNTDGLNVLRLDEKHNILEWLSILADNRLILNRNAKPSIDYLTDNYLPNYKDYDVIIGYRADDAYFKFVREFLLNIIGLNVLSNAMYLGDLGLQVFIQSEKAFKQLEFQSSVIVKKEHYGITHSLKVEQATNTYESLKDQDLDDIYIRDIRSGLIENDSIPRIKIK